MGDTIWRLESDSMYVYSRLRREMTETRMKIVILLGISIFLILVGVIIAVILPTEDVKSGRFYIYWAATEAPVTTPPARTTPSEDLYFGSGVIITGGSVSGVASTSVELYNPHSQSSCQLPELPEPRYEHTMCGGLLCGGDIYKTDRSCLMFNPLTGTFTYTEVPLTAKRKFHLCWNLDGGEVLLLGGFYNQSTSELVTSDGSSVSPGFPLESRTYGGCGIEIEDSYVVTGGFNFFKHFENQNRMLQEDKFYKDVIDGLKTVTRYNRTGYSQTLPKLQVGRSEHGCGKFVNSEGVTVLMVTGGANYRGIERFYLDSTEILQEDSWTFSTPLPSARYGLRAASLSDRIFVFGGFDEELKYLDVILRYDATKQSWEKAGNMMEGREMFSIDVLEDVTKLCP